MAWRHYWPPSHQALSDRDIVFLHYLFQQTGKNRMTVRPAQNGRPRIQFKGGISKVFSLPRRVGGERCIHRYGNIRFDSFSRSSSAAGTDFFLNRAETV